MLVWLLIACPRRGAEAEIKLEALVDAADTAWERRGEIGLEAASKPLLDAWMQAPDDPRVAWRLARWRLTEGLVATDPDEARAAFAQAREVAIGCLEDDLLFVQRRAGNGWEPALAELAPMRQPCAAWGALAWARWMSTLDPAAASLDLPTVEALARAGTSTRPQIRGVARWAEGILFAVRPTWAGRDYAVAGVALGEAIEAAPDAIVRRVDLYELVVLPQGDVEEAAALRDEILAMAARTPEDSAAQARLRPQ